MEKKIIQNNLSIQKQVNITIPIQSHTGMQMQDLFLNNDAKFTSITGEKYL